MIENKHSNRKPNIIIIVADDMGYGDCSSFGSKTINTPHIDSIASNGVRFSDFHSNGAVCSPTRAALLTGRYQQRTGIEGVISAQNHREVGLPQDERTFAELLKEKGYATAIFGKWHLGYDKKFNPTFRGFDEFVGFVSGNIDYFSHIDQMGNEDWWRSDSLQQEEGYTTDLVTDHGLRFMNENQDKPFCMYLAHECPHYPYQGPKDKDYRTIGTGKQVPINGPREDKEAAYIEMMESMDEGIGKIIKSVQDAGIEENTLIFFFSDNGPSGPGSAGELRGGKGTMWEGGHRIPAAACWKGVIPSGIQSDTPCIGMDLFPTMMSMAGVEIPDNLTIDGKNILPVMKGELNNLDRDLYWRQRKQKAIRSGKWKLVINGANGNERELFNLDIDLAENNNIITEHTDLADELEKKIIAWEKDVAKNEMLA
jgi:arylsulfatase A